MRRSHMGRVLKTGATVGSLVGLLASIVVVGWLWLADVKEGTEYAAKMAGPVLLVCVGGSTIGVMLVYAVRYARNDLASVLQQNQAVIGPDEWEQIPAGEFPQPPYEERWDEIQTGREYAESLEGSPALDAVRPAALLNAVVKCIKEQLIMQYQYGKVPTRKFFETEGDTPQPVWNTARGILRRAGFVDDSGRSWAPLSWEAIAGMLDRIRPEGDHRIWVPAGSGHGLINATMSQQLQAGNTHLIPLPH